MRSARGGVARSIDADQWAATLLAEAEGANRTRGLAARDINQPPELRESVEHSYRAVLHYGLEGDSPGPLTVQPTMRRSEHFRPSMRASRRREPSDVARSLSTLRPEYGPDFSQAGTLGSMRSMQYDTYNPTNPVRETLSALREDIMDSYEETCEGLHVPPDTRLLSTSKSQHVSSLRQHIRQADEGTGILAAATRRRLSAPRRPPSEELASSSQLLYPPDSIDELKQSGSGGRQGKAASRQHGMSSHTMQRHAHHQAKSGGHHSAAPPLYERLVAAGTREWSADRLDKWLAEWAAGPVLPDAPPPARRQAEHAPGRGSERQWNATLRGLAVF